MTTNTNTSIAAALRSLGAARSRREALVAFLGGLPGVFLAIGTDPARAKKKGKGKHKKKCRKCGRCQQCQKGKCKPVAAGAPCGAGQQCAADGRCLACDVCASGCAFSSVQAAIDAAAPGDTIRLCPGSFAGLLKIEKDLALLGAGDGAGGSTLDGQGAGLTATVTVNNADVTFAHLRITGGAGFNGGGLRGNGSRLTLDACTVSGNKAERQGAGIFVLEGVLILNDSTVTDNETRDDSGGGIFSQDSTTTLVSSSVRGNRANERGGGIFLLDGAMSLFDSRVEDNTAGELGGGIFRDSGAISLIDSTVSGNTPDNCAGLPTAGCANP